MSTMFARLTSYTLEELVLEHSDHTHFVKLFSLASIYLNFA